MVNKQNKPSSEQSNFEAWKESLTPESIADGKFITLSCGGCPVGGSACNKHDTNCRSNFLSWARSEAKPDDAAVTALAEVPSDD